MNDFHVLLCSVLILLMGVYACDSDLHHHNALLEIVFVIKKCTCVVTRDHALITSVLVKILIPLQVATFCDDLPLPQGLSLLSHVKPNEVTTLLQNFKHPSNFR